MRRLGDGDVNYQCLECPATQVCVQAGEAWENNWCYLKDPAVNYRTLGLAVDQERLPVWDYGWCVNCAAEEMANSVCTWATNYFTTQPGTNITCPAASATYEKTFYSRDTSSSSVVSETTATATVHFWEDTTLYPYPFCKTDVTYYT
jgi:hypothetical protein